MSILSVPYGPDAVQAYRITSVPVDQKVVNLAPGLELIEWLGKNGMDWDAYWTNSWDKDANAIAGMMRDFDIPVIMDVDDYFEGVPSGNVAHRAWVYERPKLFRAMLAGADRRIASTPFLADKYNCKVAPNFVDLASWDYPTRPKGNKVVLLHCGSLNRAEDFLQQERALKVFLAEKNTQIIFMGWMPEWARHYEPGKVVFCHWVNYREAPWGYKYNRMLKWLDPDIVVSPLVHNDFNIAKSNIKWLESAMIGAAFVGERWGELERTVTSGEDGFLCDGYMEWSDTLQTLSYDGDLRARTSKAAQDVVSSKWTWGGVEQHWRAALEG